MKLTEIKTDKMLAVVYGGRFQPFHQGHYGVWLDLIKKFSKNQVWIATSNKTNFNKATGDVSPLTFAEKKELITQIYEIPDNKIIQAVNPSFSPKEVLELYKGPTVLVLVVGDKDVARYKDVSYFKPWPTKEGAPISWNSFKDKAEIVNGTDNSTSYYLVNDTKRLPGVTGTKVRARLLELADDKEGLKSEFKRVFGKWDPEIARMLIAKLKQIRN